MRTLTTMVSAGAIVAGVALPVAAQQRTHSETPKPLMEHAAIGLLEAVDTHNGRIVIQPVGAIPIQGQQTHGYPRNYQSYVTNEQTAVEGLGSVMNVGSALAEYAGNVVVVTYEERGEHYIAKRINFTNEHQVRETRGTIRTVDPETRTLVLRNADGRDEELNLGSGPGATIDSARGLLRFSDLRTGESMRAYFGAKPFGGGDVTYLVMMQ